MPPLLFFLGLITGCDLAVYERRMETEESRLEYFEVENRFLDDPLDLPKKIEEKPAQPGAPPAGGAAMPAMPGAAMPGAAPAAGTATMTGMPEPVFFRPPKGIRRVPERKVGSLLWEYAHTPQAPTFYFAYDQSKDKMIADLKARTGFDPGRCRQEPMQAPGRPAVIYEHWEDPSTKMDVYIGSPAAPVSGMMSTPGAGAGHIVGVVFQYDRPKTQLTLDQKTAQDYSLKSLAFGRAAQLLRQISPPKPLPKPVAPAPAPGGSLR